MTTTMMTTTMITTTMFTVPETLIRYFHFHQWMILIMFSSSLANFAQIVIGTYRTLISKSNNRRFVATITGDSFMNWF